MRVRNNEMMRLTTPFPNFNNIMGGDIPHDITWLLIGQGFDYLRRHRKTLFNPKNIRKNFGWFEILCLGLCFVPLAWLSILFAKNRLKPIGKIIDNELFRIIGVGFKIFIKIEPQLALEIARDLEKLKTAYQVGKITGIYKFDIEK